MIAAWVEVFYQKWKRPVEKSSQGLQSGIQKLGIFLTTCNVQEIIFVVAGLPEKLIAADSGFNSSLRYLYNGNRPSWTRGQI